MKTSRHHLLEERELRAGKPECGAVVGERRVTKFCAVGSRAGRLTVDNRVVAERLNVELGSLPDALESRADIGKHRVFAIAIDVYRTRRGMLTILFGNCFASGCALDCHDPLYQ